MLQDFRHVFGSHPTLAPKMGADSHLDIGLIESINLETQMMDVTLIWKNNIVVKDIPISQPVSADGAGVRFIPKKNMVVLLHFDPVIDNGYYHIGYYNGNLDIFTNNFLGTKTDNRLTMRCLDTGEIVLSNGNGSELYLSNKNTVLLKNGAGFFITLDQDEFKGLFNDLNFSLNDASVDIGRIKRVKREYKEEVTDTNAKIIRDENNSALNECSFSIGTYNNEQGIPDIQKNEAFDFNTTPTGRFVIADQIFDEIGQQVTSLKTLTDVADVLQFMLKMGTGIKIGIDSEGSLYIVNEYTDSHIKFKIGATTDGSKVTDETELEIKIAKSICTINKDGEFTFTNENIDDENKKVSITTTKDAVITVKNTTDGSKYNTITLDDKGISIIDGNENQITLTEDKTTIQSAKELLLTSNGGGGEEKSLLGETLQKGIDKLLQKIATHTHGGPPAPPVQAADFILLGQTDLGVNTVLSQKTKNN